MSIVQLLFRRWWVVSLQGLLLIVLSIYIVQNPVAVMTGISFWFGVLVLATGLLGIVSWMAADTPDRGALSVVWSMATAAFGLLMLMNTFATMKAITVIFGLWMLLTGLQLIQAGWSMRARSLLGWIMLGSGVLSVAAATVMILNVRTGAIGVSTLLGLQVMLAGIALVLLSVAKKVVAGALTSKVASSSSRAQR